jgi:creatine kinase
MHNKILTSNYGGLALGDPKDTTSFKFFTYEQIPAFTSSHQSLLSKVLTNDLFEALKHKKTSKGFTFSNVIQSGVECPSLNLGVVAGDKESYSVFKDLFYEIIKQYHNFDPALRRQISNEEAIGLDLTEFNKLDLNKYITATRIRGIRNISGYPLPAGTNDHQRAEVENLLKKVFKGFKKNFSGNYHSIDNLSKAELKNLRAKGYMFIDPTATSLLFNSGGSRNWPKNRGIFYNDDHTVVCWCNNQDHCSIISLQPGHDVKKTFEKFQALSDTFVNNLTSSGKTIMQDGTLGYLSTCPSNLGTGFRASVKIKLPKLLKDGVLLNKICKKHLLQIKVEHQAKNSDYETILDISNQKNLGATDVELLQNVINGVVKLIRTEEKM